VTDSQRNRSIFAQNVDHALAFQPGWNDFRDKIWNEGLRDIVILDQTLDGREREYQLGPLAKLQVIKAQPRPGIVTPNTALLLMIKVPDGAYLSAAVEIGPLPETIHPFQSTLTVEQALEVIAILAQRWPIIRPSLLGAPN